MSELFWPGSARAGALFSDAAFLDAMFAVEASWLRALRVAGLVDAAVAEAMIEHAHVDPDRVAAGAESGGNPVIALVALLREAVPPSARPWVHRGLTSQDVLDTALMLCARDAVEQVERDAARQAAALRDLADAHRTSVQAGRTLTQHAVPTTFGLTAANWLEGILDALQDLRALAFPVQVGGAAGTLAALVVLAGDPDAAAGVVDTLAAELDLSPAPPWHTNRRPMTRIGDALLAGVDACGHIANDVLLRSRPEIGELAESAPGASSTMPHKQNPVLSVLIRRAAIAAPFHAAQLHAAAAAAVDERPDGAWHAEWAALRSLARLALTAASQTADLVEGLVVHPDRMAATAAAAADALLAEQRAVTGRAGEITGYLGATDRLITRAVERADQFLKGTQ